MTALVLISSVAIISFSNHADPNIASLFLSGFVAALLAAILWDVAFFTRHR